MFLFGLMLGACDSVDNLAPLEMVDFENGLDYFEAKLDYFAAAAELLETEAFEMDSRNGESEDILSESYALLEQIETANYDFNRYVSENFERLCTQDGGIFWVDEEYDSRWCEHPPHPEPTPVFDRREEISYRFSQLIPRTLAIEYAFLKNLADFENLLDELETDFNEFESEFDGRLAYIEANDAELWHQVLHYQGHWEAFEDIMPDIFQFENRIRAIRIGLDNYASTNTNPRESTGHLRRRLNDFYPRMLRIRHPSGLAG